MRLTSLKSAKFIFSILAGSVLLSPAAMAHDFWLQPNAFQPQTPRPLAVQIMIGHPEDRTQWTLNPHRVISFRSFSAAGVTDQQTALSDTLLSGAVRLDALGKGTHILTIETTSAVSELSHEKFNAYLKEEGLTPISDDRTQRGITDTPGREIYSRRGKALIQVGDYSRDADAFVTSPLGLTLEITPRSNPYGLEAGAPMDAGVHYRGAPTAGVTVGLIRLDNDDGLVAVQKTDAQGNVSFPRPAAGSWMLHAVWSDPLENDARADYDTIFSSLSFGFGK